MYGVRSRQEKKCFHASIFIHVRNTLKFNVDTSQYKNMNLTESTSLIFLIHITNTKLGTKYTLL